MLADPNSAVPALIRPTMKLLVEEIRLLETRISQLERELTLLARESPACTTLLSIPGVGLLTATAMVAATSGNVGHFHDARHFASWFGLTPKEHSSGSTRRLGRISKRGDRYLRMLLTHGARIGAARRQRWRQGRAHARRAAPLGARACRARSNHNKATCALANKLARICYATLRDGDPTASPQRARTRRSTAPRSPSPPERSLPTNRSLPEPCLETDRPSWQTGSPPHRLTPITLPAASRLPLATIGATVFADSMSARATQSPLTMPDIRLQAHPRCQNYRSVSLLLGGSPYTRVSRCRRFSLPGRSSSVPSPSTAAVRRRIVSTDKRRRQDIREQLYGLDSPWDS